MLIILTQGRATTTLPNLYQPDWRARSIDARSSSSWLIGISNSSPTKCCEAVASQVGSRSIPYRCYRQSLLVASSHHRHLQDLAAAACPVSLDNHGPSSLLISVKGGRHVRLPAVFASRIRSKWAPCSRPKHDLSVGVTVHNSGQRKNSRLRRLEEKVLKDQQQGWCEREVLKHGHRHGDGRRVA
jgi:hypothetical protein